MAIVSVSLYPEIVTINCSFVNVFEVSSFSVLTLFVGRQEGLPACKNFFVRNPLHDKQEGNLLTRVFPENGHKSVMGVHRIQITFRIQVDVRWSL